MTHRYLELLDEALVELRACLATTDAHARDAGRTGHERTAGELHTKANALAREIGRLRGVCNALRDLG